MTEEKKVITIDDVEYTEDQLSDEAKGCLNHISNFAFSYTNTLGRVSTFAYNMEKEAEGYMVMFPSTMLHQVFPFYDNDGERISISGNINIANLEG